MNASKILTLSLIALASLILLFGSFQLGMTIGERKEAHASDWCNRYGRMFTFVSKGPEQAPPPRPFPNGAFGRVLSASGTGFVIQGKDGMEQNIVVTTSTVIRIGTQTGGSDDVKPDMDVSVFGVPNPLGQIEAHLIRIFDAQ